MLEPDIQLVVDPEVLQQLEKRISRIERQLDDEPTLVYDTGRVRDRSGRYVIEERLAQGGMAELFVARTSVTGIASAVVLKTLLPRFAGDATFVAMLFNEARIVGNLCHPNIVRVEDSDRARRSALHRHGALEGVNLRQMLGRAARSDCAVPAGIACHIVGKVLAALGHAHDREDDAGRPLGLVHRDVSLVNVMVTWAGSVKLHRLRHRQGDASARRSGRAPASQGQVLVHVARAGALPAARRAAPICSPPASCCGSS